MHRDGVDNAVVVAAVATVLRIDVDAVEAVAVLRIVVVDAVAAVAAVVLRSGVVETEVRCRSWAEEVQAPRGKPKALVPRRMQPVGILVTENA